MKKGIVLVLLLTATAGLGWWWATPSVSLECPGKRAPKRVVAAAGLAAGHGAFSGGFTLEEDRLTITSFDGPRPSRLLEPGELDALAHRLRTPRPLPSHLGHAETVVRVEVECDGHTRSLEGEAVVGRQHPTFASVLASPSLWAFESWLEGTARDLDPRAKKLTALTLEVLAVGAPELLSGG